MGWGNESNMVSEKVTKYNVNHMLMDLDSMLKNNQRFMLKCISNIIKHERIKKDLTERAVSDKSGIPLFEYLRFESDSENIGARRIIDITNALNMDFYYFIGSLVGCQAAMKALDSINITDQEKENVQNELAKSIIYRK
jgi:transcriptional regulator with XRE-family HTH domain